jgi:hypothetical protein
MDFEIEDVRVLVDEQNDEKERVGMWTLGREEGKAVNSEFEALREELRVFELGVLSVNSETRDWK